MGKIRVNEKKAPQNAVSYFLIILTSIMLFYMTGCDSTPTGPSEWDLSSLTFPDSDFKSYDFIASLDGGNVVPPVETTATATLSAYYLVVGVAEPFEKLIFRCNIKNIKQEDVTGFDIHRGVRGENGKVLAFLIKSPHTSMQYYLESDSLHISVHVYPETTEALNQVTVTQIGNTMRKWKTYVDIHTKKHPKGEIRGQIKPS